MEAELENKKVIFIGGTSYSGSTMLDMMLANDENGFSTGEVSALFYPYRPHHFNPICGCGNKNCNIWKVVKENGVKDLYKTLFKTFPHVNYIVDSSKDPWWIKKQVSWLKAQGIGIDSYILLIWKDPIEFAYSMMKRGRKGWIRVWNNYHKLYLIFFPDCICVSYKQLVKQPAKILRGLCGKINIAYHEGKEFFWNKKHHTLFGNHSAKIHLYNTNEYNNSKYRTIYYDETYINKISEKDLRAIKNNCTTNLILKALIEKSNGNDEVVFDIIQTIKLSNTEYYVSFCKYLIKKIVGWTLGRYIKIF